MSYTRFAIFFVPPSGPFAEFGAAWLGWDVAQGREIEQFNVTGLKEITDTPRKYGFHATLKPPFHLHDGTTEEDLASHVAGLANRLSPGTCSGLKLVALGRFLALVPDGDSTELNRIAALYVTELDKFRRPASADEITRRRSARLTPEQDALLQKWGYPYVLDAFRFHMTLTGRLPKSEVDGWITTVEAHLPQVPGPFEIHEIALVGERTDGRFEVIRRFALTG